MASRHGPTGIHTLAEFEACASENRIKASDEWVRQETCHTRPSEPRSKTHLQRNSGVASFSLSLSLYSHLLYLDLDTTLASPAARLFKSTLVSSSVPIVVPHPYPPRSEMPNQSIPSTPIPRGFFYFSPSNNSSNRAFSWCSVSCVSFPLVDDGGRTRWLDSYCNNRHVYMTREKIAHDGTVGSSSLRYIRDTT